MDDDTVYLKSRMLSGDWVRGWTLDDDRDLRFQNRVFVPVACRDEVLKEFHHSRFAVHPRDTKMYHDLCRQYWWKGLKRAVVEFVAS